MTSLFGVLNLNKPAGMTSRDVVNVVQRLIRPTKCGHAGTLDPMATGVLLVCVGPATRLISLLQNTTKLYSAEFRLGERSNTDDSSGNVRLTDTPFRRPTAGDIRQCLDNMVGTIAQVPPAFSAVHVDGQRAYRLARDGQDVQLAPKEVRIDHILITDYQWPVLKIDVACGSGTYIRSIARDLGEQLNCGGLMSSLVRTRIGEFDLSAAVSVDELTLEKIRPSLHPARSIVSHLPVFECSPAERKAILSGKSLSAGSDSPYECSPVTGSQAVSGSQIALVDAETNELLGLAEPVEDGRRLQPRIVFAKD